MANKKKFKPQVTRVKLNPEQAVLGCSCYDIGIYHIDHLETRSFNACIPEAKEYDTRATHCVGDPAGILTS
ncbi:MAG: hypothetical protein V2A72_04295 [Candidatus Omnitrophota bacterium]